MTLGGPGVALCSATAAAVAFGAAAALQHRAAAHVPDAQQLRPRELARFARATLAHPVWLLGIVAEGIGLGLHVVALRAGALAVVQTVIVSGVLFGLVIDRLIDRRPPQRQQIAWAALLAIGLGAFLVGAGLPHSTPVFSGGRALLALGVSAAVIAAGAALSRRFPGAPAAALLGAGAGIAFACTAALIKVCVDVAARNPAALFTDWPLYGLIAVGGLGLLLNQLAFQAGPLSAALPALTVANPLVSVAFGVVLFHERLGHTPGALAVEAVGLVAASAAAVRLSRARAGADRRPAPAPRPEPLLDA